jgi:hypothetical protein
MQIVVVSVIPLRGTHRSSFRSKLCTKGMSSILLSFGFWLSISSPTRWFWTEINVRTSQLEQHAAAATTLELSEKTFSQQQSSGAVWAYLWSCSCR